VLDDNTLTDNILLLYIIYITLTDYIWRSYHIISYYSYIYNILLLQIIYGGHISNSYDQQTLNAIVDYWASPLAVKKDFELSRGELMLYSYWFNVSSKFFVVIPRKIRSIDFLLFSSSYSIKSLIKRNSIKFFVVFLITYVII